MVHFSQKCVLSIPRVDFLFSDDSERCFYSCPNFLFMNFYIIQSMSSNSHYVEYHLSSLILFLFFTETQMSRAADSNLYPVPSYFLYSVSPQIWLPKCTSTCSRAHDLDPSGFVILILTTIISVMYIANDFNM